MSLADTVSQQQAIINILLEKLHRPHTKGRKEERALYPIKTDRVEYHFDMENLRVIYTLKRLNVKIAKHYGEHAMRIMHGRIVREPDGEYARECIAQAHWGVIRPTKYNYPL